MFKVTWMSVRTDIMALSVSAVYKRLFFPVRFCFIKETNPVFDEMLLPKFKSDFTILSSA